MPVLPLRSANGRDMSHQPFDPLWADDGKLSTTFESIAVTLRQRSENETREAQTKMWEDAGSLHRYAR